MGEKMAEGSAIGKVILMGEHAVVYGQPAISIPFPKAHVKTTIHKKKGSVNLDCIYYKGQLFEAPEILQGLSQIIRDIIHSFGKELEDFAIRIDSSIPPERGMGSSAAVAIATVRSLYNFYKIPLTNADLMKWTSVSEKIVHGNPSGIDAMTIAKERALYYIKGNPFQPFKIKLNAYLIVGDTGQKGQTKNAVESVKQEIESDSGQGETLIRELGMLTRIAKSSINNNDAGVLGEVMTQAHNSLDSLGVSNEKLNHLVSVAINNGALGGKLTGGGRGGCMIALAADKDQAQYISKKLLENGAKNTWISFLGEDANGL